MEDPDLAVALGYDPDRDAAPRVVAKGRGAIAAQIVALAREHGVAIRRDRDLAPLRTFMLGQVRPKDLELFLDISRTPALEHPEDTPLRALIPAFMISELRRAFEIGFLIFVPFLVIDMVVASVLMSMGMMMLPPVLISLPFKLIFFVLVDGWYLVVGSLVESFSS